MELANHKLLKSKDKRFNEQQTKVYFIQISRAINHLHKRLITHPELKLDNILIVELVDKEVIKVTDLWISCFSFEPSKGIINISKTVGTIPYMSQELLRNLIKVNCKMKEIEIFGKIRKYNPYKCDICLSLLLTTIYWSTKVSQK
jgi:serine/threonine protein kinase